MIAILFTAGNFGSTIEYCLRQFSVELTKIYAEVMYNGSMHAYKKAHHPASFSEWDLGADVDIITAVFPNQDFVSGRDCLEWYQRKLTHDKVILIDSANAYQAERCQLFAYHKINHMLDVVMKDKAQSWNRDYVDWRHMQKSELREALSFYIDQQHDLIDLKRYVPRNWHVTTPQDILYDLPRQVRLMLDYCGLTCNGLSIDEFHHGWLAKQQYILQEAETINTIIDSVISNAVYSWDQLSIIGEAIVQSRLRRLGHELDMSGLNIFPSDTEKLISRFFID